jgi:hypothetical protein
MQKVFYQQLRSQQAINPVPAGNQLSVCKHAVLPALSDVTERTNYQSKTSVQAFFEIIFECAFPDFI